MSKLIRLFVLAALPLTTLVLGSVSGVAADAPSISVQGCVATILNVPEGGTTLITGTIGDQDFSTSDNPATLVSGNYHWSVTVDQEVIASGDFTIEGCPAPSPSPIPTPTSRPSFSPLPCSISFAASAVRCPSPRPIPKPPTTGVADVSDYQGLMLAALALVAGTLLLTALFVTGRRRI